MNFKLFASAALGAVLATTGIAAATTLKISHVRPQDTQVDLDLKAFGEELDTATDGNVKIRIFAANALGDYTTVQEKVSIGAVDMSLQPTSSTVDRRMQIAYLPYMATDYDHARELYLGEGVIRQAVEELYVAQDITVLAAYPAYFGGISLNQTGFEPANPDAAKGIKVRVPGVKAFQLLAENLGFIPSPIPFSEAFTSVQTGVVDGVIGSGAEGYYASFRDVTKTFIRANTHFELWFMLINTPTFEKLDAADQQALRTAASNFEAARWEAAMADQELNEQRLREEGAEIVVLSAEQLSEAAKAVRENVWPIMVKDLGEDWAQPLLDAVVAAQPNAAGS